jgi:hypothetical protein
VARETAKRSQGILDTSQQVVTGISTYKKGLNKVVVPPDCCGNCGNKRHSDRKDCPAKDNVCSCGIKGHFRKYCYRDGKKRNPQSGGGKKTTKTDEADSKEETSHGIGENCFSLQAEVKTNRGPGISTDPLKPPPTMPTIYQPKEVILASLQNSEGNDRWVNRAKDEVGLDQVDAVASLLITVQEVPGDPQHQPAGGDWHLHLQEGPEQGRRAPRLLWQLWQQKT